jgi:hypothetical protein
MMGLRWRGAGQRELAELTGTSAGCRCGKLRRMLVTEVVNVNETVGLMN